MWCCGLSSDHTADRIVSLCHNSLSPSFFLLGLQFLFLECSTRTSTTNGICVTPWLGWITGDLLAEGPSSQSPQHQKKIERSLFTRNKVVTMVDTIKQDFRRVFPCGISCPPSNCVCRHIATKKIQWLSKNAAESSVGGRKKNFMKSANFQCDLVNTITMEPLLLGSPRNRKKEKCWFFVCPQNLPFKLGFEEKQPSRRS